ncbi:pyridoxal-phosphate dependent enzyme [Trinickia fusca]|nr:pyridoxal-phosphate dependent enzyme [Trinickia fusca]
MNHEATVGGLTHQRAEPGQAHTTHLTLASIEAAARVLRQRLPQSPLVEPRMWRTAGGAPIFVKAECLLPTGSFKIRGATLFVASLTDEQRARGVIAYSTGNHAQAVAKAAADAGVSALIVMSPDAPEAKVRATQSWGAQVVMSEPTSDARRAMAERLAAESGRVLIPPYDDWTVMTGQASIGLELREQLKAGARLPAAVFVPVGGGGLLAGVAAAVKMTMPSVRVIGVEPELENDTQQSFAAGRIVRAAGPSASIADAIKVQAPGNLTFPVIVDYVDEIVSVSEREIAQASLRYFDEAHLVVEPGGAVALAAALKWRGAEIGATADDQAGEPAPVVVLAAGGNVTLERLAGLRSMA